MDDATILMRVAVEVMGRHPDSYSAEVMGDFSWDYAGRVVKKMQEKGFICVHMALIDGTHMVYFQDKSTPEPEHFIDASFPRAVMLAALKALEATCE